MSGIDETGSMLSELHTELVQYGWLDQAEEELSPANQALELIAVSLFGIFHEIKRMNDREDEKEAG